MQIVLFFLQNAASQLVLYDAHFKAYSKSFFRLLTRISRGLSKRPSGP